MQLELEPHSVYVLPHSANTAILLAWYRSNVFAVRCWCVRHRCKCDWRISLASYDRDVCTVVEEDQKVVRKIALYYFVIDTAHLPRLSASSGEFGRGG
jgi:hypothetical protein